MHYIRLLKTPKVHVEGASITLRAVITITTDLGETFYPDDVDLTAIVCSAQANGDVYLRRTISWSAGMRALPLSIDLTRTKIKWPARLVVGAPTKQRLEAHNEAGRLPDLYPVWSEELNPTKGVFETKRRVERKVRLASGGDLAIYEDTGDSIARHLWDGSLALTAHLDRLVAAQSSPRMPLLESTITSATRKKLNVLELGCGCGIVGIGVAQMIPDCNILLTDLPEVDELVAQNIECMTPANASTVSFAPLDWEAPLPPAVRSRKWDIIIAAECIYNVDSIPLLVTTLTSLIAASPGALIVVSTKVRHDSEKLFHELAAKEGLVESGRAELPLPGLPGTGYGDSATHVDLYTFHGKQYKQA